MSMAYLSLIIDVLIPSKYMSLKAVPHSSMELRLFKAVLRGILKVFGSDYGGKPLIFPRVDTAALVLNLIAFGVN